MLRALGSLPRTGAALLRGRTTAVLPAGTASRGAAFSTHQRASAAAAAAARATACAASDAGGLAGAVPASTFASTPASKRDAGSSSSSKRPAAADFGTLSSAADVRGDGLIGRTVGGLSPIDLVKTELGSLSSSIRMLLNNDHPALDRVAKYLFQREGKGFRPMVVLLMARATSELTPESPREGWSLEDGVAPEQRRLAEIAEIIHTGSLLHDDVVDLALTRRSAKTANVEFGNKVAVLGGDFLLAKACLYTARLRNPDVVELVSTIIENLVEGEIMQSRTHDKDALTDFSYYMHKTYLKTASLLANASKAAVLIAGHSELVIEQSFLYGKHLGIAFQLVDDMLDFTGTEAAMGKKVDGADLKAGLATAPVLFAMETYPELRDMIARQFKEVGDVQRALRCVRETDSVERTAALAREHAQLAVDAVMHLPPSDARDALVKLADEVLERKS